MLWRLWRRLYAWLFCAYGHDDHEVRVRWINRPDLPSQFTKCYRCGRTSDGRFED